MSKFGELVKGKKPVFLHFYINNNTLSERMHEVVQEVATHFGEAVKVAKLDVEANRELVRALQITSLPDFIIYKEGEMLWRAQGGRTVSALIKALEPYVSA